jgi:hypothetical protein
LGGKDEEDCGSKQNRGNSSQDSTSKIPSTIKKKKKKKDTLETAI